MKNKNKEKFFYTEKILLIYFIQFLDNLIKYIIYYIPHLK